MKAQPLTIPILVDGLISQDGALPVEPKHIASWQSLEPSSSTSTPFRRVAFACPDNTIWITTLPDNPSTSTITRSPDLPQLVVPSNHTNESAGGSRTPTGSRLSRPIIPRSSSFAGRHRASSSASSILSATSRRRASALSPPPSATPLAAVSTTTASADPHAGHDHRKSSADRSELLGHLREQRGAGTTQDDGRLGLGIAGLGRRGLSGVHSKEDISQQDGGAVSPRSSKSTESARTISTRLMGWIGDEKVSNERERKELMERVQEVEVEREMLREVEEDRREEEEEKLIESARRTPVGTPTLGRDAEVATRVKRIILRQAPRGKIVLLKADEEVGVLIVLRDIGILDIISLITLEVTESINLEEPEPAPKLKLRLSPFWQWRGVQVIQHANEPLIIAHGLPWPCGLPSPNGEVTRVVMLRTGKSGTLDIVARLDLPGEGDIGVMINETGSYILHSTSSALTSYSITSPSHNTSTSTPSSTQLRSTPQLRSVSAANPSIPSSPLTLSPNPSQSTSGDSAQLRKSKSTVQLRDAADLPLPYPPEQKERERSLAKFLASRRGEKEVKPKPEVIIGWGVGAGMEIKQDFGTWERMSMIGSGLGIGFGADGIHHIKISSSEGAEARIIDEGKFMCLRSQNGIRFYRNPGEHEDEKSGFDPWAEVFAAKAHDVICSAGLGRLLLMTSTGVDILQIPPSGDVERTTIVTLNKGTPRGEISIITPYNIDTCFVADASGNVLKRQLADILSGSSTPDEAVLSSDRLEARVSCMKIVKNSRDYLVAGDEDGVVRIWDAETFGLQGSWTLFAFPVQTITLLNSPQIGSLNNTILCTSQAGTVGLISLTDMEQMFLIPASRVPLRRVYIGGKDIMLAYANGKARVWNYETQEFRRSTGLDAAEDMLNTGDWTAIDIEFEREEGALLAVTSSYPLASDIGRLLQLDVRQLCTFVQQSRSSMSNSPLATLRTILSMLIPFGVDTEVDKICEGGLGIRRPSQPLAIGNIGSSGSISSINCTGANIWRISTEITGPLQLAIVTLLRPFLDSPDHEQSAAQLIAYFTASLPDGSIMAELPFFAAYYLDPITDIHQAARMLFGCRMDSMEEANFAAVVDSHLPELPSFLPSADQHLEAADLALTMLGGMALHKYQSMTPAALKAIAESIVIYLNSSVTSHLALAIELASKGFTTWQTYVDPAEMLRRLFFLSTQIPPTSSTANTTTLGSQIPATARLAVLHVASSNPALFMSTLSMDILDAKSVEGRKSIMKLCVYMARKRPDVLENSLPRVVEAVVKSLDPNVGKMREDVQQTATVILNELVLAFSTVDFNSATQKLAVGTHEGALIMYDLKTASRLYILEPHKHPISAVNFSPDGRRLITVCLEEGGLTVWKIGSSLSGFFNVGGPPRQGGKPGEPFKRIEFARADNVPLDSTSALSDVQISWPGLKQAKVVIKETAMTFET